MIWSQACTRWLQTYSYQRNSKHGQHPSALRKSATHGPVHNRPMSVFWNSKKQIQLFSDSTRVGTVQDKLRHADPKTHPDTQRHGWMICPQIHARMWMHAWRCTRMHAGYTSAISTRKPADCKARLPALITVRECIEQSMHVMQVMNYKLKTQRNLIPRWFRHQTHTSHAHIIMHPFLPVLSKHKCTPHDSKCDNRGVKRGHEVSASDFLPANLVWASLTVHFYEPDFSENIQFWNIIASYTQKTP